MWWWACMLFPRRFLIWNLPGKNYFDDILTKISRGRYTKFPLWLYPIMHCVPVDRGGGNLREVIKQSNKVITAGHTLVVFGETRRTGSKDRNNPTADIVLISNEDGSRQVQPFTATVIITTANKNARFVDAWLDVPFWKENPGFSFRTWWTGRHVVTVTFGDSYSPDKKLSGAELQAVVQKRVLSTH